MLRAEEAMTVSTPHALAECGVACGTHCWLACAGGDPDLAAAEATLAAMLGEEVPPSEGGSDQGSAAGAPVGSDQGSAAGAPGPRPSRPPPPEGSLKAGPYHLAEGGRPLGGAQPRPGHPGKAAAAAHPARDGSEDAEHAGMPDHGSVAEPAAAPHLGPVTGLSGKPYPTLPYPPGAGANPDAAGALSQTDSSKSAATPAPGEEALGRSGAALVQNPNPMVTTASAPATPTAQQESAPPSAPHPRGTLQGSTQGSFQGPSAMQHDDAPPSEPRSEGALQGFSDGFFQSSAALQSSSAAVEAAAAKTVGKAATELAKGSQSPGRILAGGRQCVPYEQLKGAALLGTGPA